MVLGTGFYQLNFDSNPFIFFKVYSGPTIFRHTVDSLIIIILGFLPALFAFFLLITKYSEILAGLQIYIIGLFS